MLECGCVTAKAVAHKARNPANRGDADPGHVVNPAIGEILLQKTDDSPAIDQGLQLGRRTQVLEKITTFTEILQADDRPEERVFIIFLLPGRFISVGFHGLGLTGFVLMC